MDGAVARPGHDVWATRSFVQGDGSHANKSKAWVGPAA